MDNNRNTPTKANLMKKDIGRFVLYKELSKYYTADQIDQMLVDIATHGTIDLNRYVKKTEVESEISSTSEMPVQSKIIYQKLMDYYTKQETYSKEELNNLITTPEQKYVTVTATIETTAITDLLPAIGEADTIYRVGNWDGNQYDDACYTEYAWNGNEYVFLSTKPGSIVDEKYIDNPEYVRIYTDGEDKILWGITKDGDIFFGAGVPTQVKDYIEEKISALSLDEYEQIVAFLDGFINSNTTLQMLLDTKTDKANAEMQKATISGDLTVKGEITLPQLIIKNITDNPEWLTVTVDGEHKILEGIKENGTKEIGGELNVSGDTIINGNININGNAELNGVEVKNTNNPEYLQVITDSDSKIIQGIISDGTSYTGGNLQVEGDIITQGNASIYGDVNLSNESIKSSDSPEYLKVTTDCYGKVINAIKKDGSHYIHNVQSESIDEIKEKTKVSTESFLLQNNSEYVAVEVDSENKILEGVTTDGIKRFNIPIDNGAAIIGTTGNLEFIEAKVDAEGKLLEGINKNGEKIYGVIPPQIKQYIDENMHTGGGGVQSIEYDDATGDMYATYDDESGISDVYMEPDGDIYVEYDE